MKKLRSLFCLILALAMLTAAMPVLAAKVPMTVFYVDAVDAKTGEESFYQNSSGDDILWGLTSHQIKLSIVDVQPSNADKGVKFKSSNPSVASVNAKGLITCKKEGMTDITVTAKLGNQQWGITLYVEDNSVQYTSYPDSWKSELLAEQKWDMTPYRIYAKGNKVIAEMSVFNGWVKPISGSVKLYAGYTDNFLTTSSYDDFVDIGKVTIKFKGKIQPGTGGIATITLPKSLKPAVLDLRDAGVLCSKTPFGKGAAKGFDFGIDEFARSFAGGQRSMKGLQKK